MFRKLKAGLSGKSSKGKFRLDVAVARVEGLPAGATACRLQWARGAKVAVTKLVAASNGAVEWNEELSQIATLLRAPTGGYEAKPYEFKLQAPDRGQSSKPPVTIGKAAVDMARFAPPVGAAPRPQDLALQIPLAGGGMATLHLVVAATEVKCMGPDDDAMSVMTGASGLSASPSFIEQDLSGFRVENRDIGAAAAAARASSEYHRSQLAQQGGGVAATTPAAHPVVAAAAPHPAASPRRSSDAASIATISDMPSTLDVGVTRSTTAEEARQEGQGHEVEALKQEVASRDAQLAALQRELAALRLEASAAPLPASAPASDLGDDRLAELQQQSASLAGEVAQLRSQLSASAAAAAASASAAGAAAADSSQLQEQLGAAQARVGELEAQLGTASSASARAGDDATAAKLAAAEQKIQQLVAVMEQQLGAGSANQADSVAALQALVAQGERDVAEAEAMVQEAMEMAEGAQAAKESLEAEAAELRAQAEEALSSTRWHKEREAKREAEWDARLKEATRRTEESLQLAERMQREKEDLQEQYSVLLSEKKAVEAKLDPGAVDQHVALEVEAARKAAEAQARVEVEALTHRLKAMEEYVEEADARRLQAASRVAEVEALLARTQEGEEDTYGQVQAAEDRADGLSLELQYAQGEAGRLAGELELAREANERRTSDYQRDLAALAARAEGLQASLEEARASARQEGALAGQLRSRVALLEEEVEGARLATSQAQQAAALAAAAGAGIGAAAAGGSAASGEGRRLERELSERQRAGEERAAQLEAMSRELSAVRNALADAQAQREAAEAALDDAQRGAASAASRAAELESALAARDAQLQASQQAQRSSLALVSARGRGSGLGGEEGGEVRELVGQLEAERAGRAAEVAGLTQQLGEAQALAEYSAGEMAGLVQQLAEAQGERGEAAAKLAEAREEVEGLRSGPDGELRARIEQMDRELTIQRNRAEVNSLFKQEHDRIAQELVETKLVWAEAQELIVKLKRQLVKSQEKNVTFSNRLTKMETKMYSAFNGTAESMGKGAKKLGSKLSLKRGGSRDREVGEQPTDASASLASPNDP